MARVLPAEVRSAESWGDPISEAGPPPHRRRLDSAAGRICAHQALDSLGRPAPAIPRGPGGVPVWPDGVVGSITHCRGYRASAVAIRDSIASIGVDAEPHHRLPDGVLARIASPSESDAITALAADGVGGHLDRVIFCAKEAAYKAWFPLSERWLGFLDVHVDLDPESGTFAARVLHPAHGGHIPLSGRWLIDRDLILAGVAIPSTGWRGS
jgi:4'-phosphopantetheinyl transferase EntD